MYNIKPNNFAGIRVPSTLGNEENWKKTHRMAAGLWFVGGLVIAGVCMILPSKPAFITFLVMTGVLTLIPVFFSLGISKKQKH